MPHEMGENVIVGTKKINDIFEIIQSTKILSS